MTVTVGPVIESRYSFRRRANELVSLAGLEFGPPPTPRPPGRPTLTTPDVQLDRPLDRRNLIRGGAMLAGAAGATVIGAALSPTTAHAADGGTVTLGADNAASSATRVTIGGATGSATPTLVLNNANGPTLALEALPQDTEISLGVGEIVNTVAGPQIGVDYGDGDFTTFLATGVDVTNAYPIQAERVLDTRSATSRANDVVNGSSGPRFDSLGRLAGGEVHRRGRGERRGARPGRGVPERDGIPADGWRLRRGLHARSRRALPSITFQRQVTATNSIFVAPSTSAPTSASDTYYTVRVYASRPTHVMIDVLGAITGDTAAPASTTQGARTAAAPPEQAAGQADQGDSGAGRSHWSVSARRR